MTNSNITTPTATPLSTEDFRALGEDKIVYSRQLTGKQLKAMFPQAKDAPEQIEFEALFGADGTPLLITDDQDAIHRWLAEKGQNIAVRH
ncbi:DUF1150 family protein [Maritalea sp.]|uniref:DUF1150 family protein n=1 Tax=Maritalea sp. TaxID=2003361 RepID=UPI003EF5CF9B